MTDHPAARAAGEEFLKRTEWAEREAEYKAVAIRDARRVVTALLDALREPGNTWEHADLAAETAAALRKHFDKVGGIPEKLRLSKAHWRLIVLALERAASSAPSTPSAFHASGSKLPGLYGTPGPWRATRWLADTKDLAQTDYESGHLTEFWRCRVEALSDVIESLERNKEARPALTVERLSTLLKEGTGIPSKYYDELAAWLLPRLAGPVQEGK